MPFISNTPESLIQRSDSKDPATTCKGLTASGRPCRRPLGISPQASPTANRKSRNGVVAVLEAEDDEHDGAAAFFCWQHQDQAESLTTYDQDQRKANIVPVQKRTSIDTLVDRLGVLEVQSETPSKQSREKRHVRVARKETLPQKWQDMDGPLLAIDSGKPNLGEKRSRASRPKATSNLGLFCCIGSADAEQHPPPPPPPRVQRHSEKTRQPRYETSKPPMLHNSHIQQSSAVAHTPQRIRYESPASRPSPRRDPSSQTQDFLSLIPKTLPPQIAAQLLAELAKPVSPHDDEGYIYMFWLTDAAISTPEPQAASSLLGDNLPSTPNGRRKSDVLQAHATRKGLAGTMTSDATILLKIGRASNVQRRMNEWTRQCGHNLSLIRFYPHTRPISPSQSTHTPPASPKTPSKVPHSHKVERLIHIELTDQRIKRNCENCGKEHREWFEVESSREGLKRIDDIIRRWTDWGRRMDR